MIAYMKCIAEAVMAKGVRGLVDWVPGGSYLYDVAADAGRRLRERRRHEEIREELRQAAQVSFEEAKVAAEQVAREVVADGPVEDRIALELYLSQVPGAVRKSLRRAEDHTGRSVPAGLALDTPDDLLKLLPPQMPRFRTGQPLPGRPGWTLLEPLGAGGFGEVWKVGHEFIPDVRAVKFCTDPVAKQRLLTHEGKLVARVMKEGRHPNVVPLADADLTGESPWLAYEYVGGGDLAGLILSWQKLPIEERVKRAVETLRVLADTAAHFHRMSPPIVHRDLKPANILVSVASGTHEGAGASLKVTDFGIGGIAAQKLLSSSRDGATAYTKAMSMVSGAYTPIYASPQQQRGESPDPRDDVHALGVIAFQMLTGRMDAGPGPRFERDLGKLGVPEWLVALVGDCIDHETAHRPTTGSVLSQRVQPPKPVGPWPGGEDDAFGAGLSDGPAVAKDKPDPARRHSPPSRPARPKPPAREEADDFAAGIYDKPLAEDPEDFAAGIELPAGATQPMPAEAAFRQGEAHYDGSGVPKDYAKARAWYEMAAAQGHAEAQNNLGALYYHGRGVAKDYASARKWFEKAAAQGNAAAQSNLGWLYETGGGVPKDRANALKWYRKAAANGHEDAKKAITRLEKA